MNWVFETMPRAPNLNQIQTEKGTVDVKNMYTLSEKIVIEVSTDK